MATGVPSVLPKGPNPQVYRACGNPPCARAVRQNLQRSPPPVHPVDYDRHRPTYPLFSSALLFTLVLTAALALAREHGDCFAHAAAPADPPTEATPSARVDERAAFVVLRRRVGRRAERYRTGVPASITAAQAILESNWGRAPHRRWRATTTSASSASRYWTGATSSIHEDDDYDAAGRAHAESCFRAYDAVGDSFADHSDFLRDRERYARLFTYDADDYEAWAHGLKACGYATDPAYAEKLIGIIERLGLAELDCPE